MNKVDETIEAICDHIIKTTKDSFDENGLVGLVEALASLISARARSEYEDR